jgi:hypothetical protein
VPRRYRCMFTMAGIGVRDPPEWAFRIPRNRCSGSIGIGVQDAPEYARREHGRVERLTKALTERGFRAVVEDMFELSDRQRAQLDAVLSIEQALRLFEEMGAEGLAAEASVPFRP